MADPEQPLNEKFCRFCGISTLPTDNFCHSCGATLKTHVTPSARVEQRQAPTEARAEPSISALTAALFILLVGDLFFRYSHAFNVGVQQNSFFLAIIGNGGQFLLELLALVGIATYYYYGGRDTLFPRGWGPLVVFAAVALGIINNAYTSAFSAWGPHEWDLFIFSYCYVAVLLVLSYIEYKKEARPPRTTPEAGQPLSARGRESLGVQRSIDELRERSRTTQKRIGGELTLLIVALPVIFFEPFVVLNPNVYGTIVDSGLVFGAVFFLVLALRMRSWQRKSRFALIDINRPNADASEQMTLEGERSQLSIFLIVYAVMAGWMIELAYRYYNSVALLTFSIFGLYLLAALLCFFVGNSVFKRSALHEIHLIEPSAADELGESVGVVPVKVRTGETHSILMNFDIVGHAPTDEGPLPHRYYEADLHAPGVDVDADKRHALFEPPATLVAMWNCLFRAAGNQALHIILEAVTPPQEPNTTAPSRRETLLAYSHDVAVESAFTLSKENGFGLLGIIVTVSGIIVGMLPILQSLLH